MRVAILLVACAFAQAEARPGHVVRVERHARRLSGEPRLCSVVPDSQQAFCYGKMPELGMRLSVLDQNKTLGVMVVDKVDPLGACRGTQSTLWTAHFHSENGAELTAAESGVAGLLDVTVDPRKARLVKVDEVPGDRPVTPEQISAFDLDDDGKADLEFVAFTCDDSGSPVTSLTNGAPDQCVELWAAAGHTYEKIRTDRIGHNCY
ncbi:MAG: hypothetical protein ABI678_09375 [Kofleriaceae bacterium]